MVEVVAACPDLTMDTQAVLLVVEVEVAAAAVAVKFTLPTFVYSVPSFHHGMSSTNLSFSSHTPSAGRI